MRPRRRYVLRVRLTDEEHDELRAAAQALGVTVSDVVRQLVRNADVVVKAKLRRVSE